MIWWLCHILWSTIFCFSNNPRSCTYSSSRAGTLYFPQWMCWSAYIHCKNLLRRNRANKAFCSCCNLFPNQNRNAKWNAYLVFSWGNLWCKFVFLSVRSHTNLISNDGTMIVSLQKWWSLFWARQFSSVQLMFQNILTLSKLDD